LDEAHRAPAMSFADVMQQMTARYMFGATATPDRRDGNHPLLYAIIGPIVARINETTLVEEGKLLLPTVQMVETPFWCPQAARMDHATNQFTRNQWYGQIIGELVEDEERNRLIAENILRNDGRHQLVLSERISHLYDIERIINDFNPEIRTVVITGKHSAREREEILEGVRTGYFRVLLATQLADEGLDIPVLDVLHLTFPRSAKGKGQKLTQQIGRIMRTAEGKQPPIVFDYVDPRVTVFRNQASARYAHYTTAKDMEVQGWIPEDKQKAKVLHDKIKAKQAARRAARSTT
jgi:superfamily II DNA or RNA helicase